MMVTESTTKSWEGETGYEAAFSMANQLTCNPSTHPIHDSKSV